MADLAMKTSGATKAAVRTIEPLTVDATFFAQSNVSSTEVEMTTGDRTWDTRLTKTAEQTKIPLNPLTPIYGGHI